MLRESLDFDSQRMKIAISMVLSLSKQKNPSANGIIAFQKVVVLQLLAKIHGYQTLEDETNNQDSLVIQ